MVYQADGNGRDCFIFLHDEHVKGKQYNPQHHFQKSQTLTEYWNKKDKQSELIAKGLAKRPKGGFPSNKSLRFSENGDGENKQNPVINRNYEFEASKDDVSTLMSTKMSESERKFRAEKLKKDIPVRIPGYSGHVPCTNEGVGISTTSNRFLEETTNRALEEEKNRYSSTEKRRADESIRKMDRTLDVPSFKKMNKDEGREYSTLSGSQGDKTHQPRPAKFSRKVKVETPNTHHIPGFSGHRPRSLHTMKCYEKNKQATRH